MVVSMIQGSHHGSGMEMIYLKLITLTCQAGHGIGHKFHVYRHFRRRQQITVRLFKHRAIASTPYEAIKNGVS
jgi:hypothetical protein